ncbi:hypothetical protein PR202_ga22756 [Eleusine coracana subsp. coracana]|uniref:Uncharacterized protein n=1 Tax=Eleusine coracana subsp. coracana TaxID=191504 RepID=A0AAV5D425_ELECO|nr:hypothetical protein PR202_ga22756 [Eleusine coracana subsp. coracana]
MLFEVRDLTDPVTLVFGCGFYNVGNFGGAADVIGLGRGPFSRVSQIQAGRYSHYFAPHDNDGDNSFEIFSNDVTPMTSHAMSTPFLASNSDAY